jgi:putative PIN family toxin of toxin-antitoxin system
LGQKKVSLSDRPRVVLDTNVLVSALLFHGPLSRLVSLWQKSRIALLISKDVLIEYVKVLSYPKFGLSGEEIKALVEENILPCAETVPEGRHPKIIIEDPADDQFLHLAVDGNAHCIVTGDKHLLTLGAYRGVKILSARDFLDSVED